MPVGDDDPYFSTGFVDDWTHKRTHDLGGTNVIWDMAGNVEQWVSMPGPLREAYVAQLEFTHPSFCALGPIEISRFAPADPYTSDRNVGQVAYQYYPTGVTRGGSRYGGASSGIYAARVSLNALVETRGAVGFRCAYRIPPNIAQSPEVRTF